ncbi:hypothetical protein BASA60_008437 [Batrachochytrium salamandrivorans]|nr:hypothetical protein BASA60_008437 [Batrachochytrium salamandrivorans]KAH9270379.1 hypothetical protein BASA83_007542 [Batrachochytrium salamandrivorans]
MDKKESNVSSVYQFCDQGQSQQGSKGFSLHDVGKRETKTILQFWLVDGLEFPQLRDLALQVFGMVCSSATSERSFSTMGFVHSKLRSSLESEKSEEAGVYQNKCFSVWKPKHEGLGRLRKPSLNLKSKEIGIVI